uniref:POU domain protein n=1 Tax=Xenopus laevis TaxID=8355 RepID=R4IMU9_XENLA|nr:DNA-binding POU V domain protein OCT-60b [Xenopus laevis]
MDQSILYSQSAFPNFSYSPGMVQDGTGNYQYFGNYNALSYPQSFHVPAIKSENGAREEARLGSCHTALFDWNRYPHIQFSNQVGAHSSGDPSPEGRTEEEDVSVSEGRPSSTPSPNSPMMPSYGQYWHHPSWQQGNPTNQPHTLPSQTPSDGGDEKPQQSHHGPTASLESGVSNTEDEEVPSAISSQAERGLTSPSLTNASIGPGTEEDGMTLEEMEEFAKELKQKRVALGYTQGDIGHALGILYGKMFSQTTICRFESLQLTFKNMCKLKPLLEQWLGEAENNDNLQEMIHKAQIEEQNRKRKMRTCFDSDLKGRLEGHFMCNQKPGTRELTEIAKELNLEKDVVRVWFCNRRQKEKSKYRMSKGLELVGGASPGPFPSDHITFAPIPANSQDYGLTSLLPNHAPFYAPPFPRNDLFPHMAPGISMGVLTG